MTSEAPGPDQDFLQRWRLVVQLASGSNLAQEFQPSLTQLVAAIERWSDERRDLALIALKDRLALTLHQQRLLATVLVDRRSRFTARQLAAIAWLVPERDLDWPAAEASLAALEGAGLLRSLDELPRSFVTRYTAGPELAELARMARGLDRPAGEVAGGLAQRLEGSPPPSVAAEPVPEPEPPPIPLGRWELELWAVCFRTRQAIHRWIRAHHDPYKAFVGNYANAVDGPKVEALAAEADRIEDELTAEREGRETVLARVMRLFDLGPVDARVLLYLFLAEVTDTGLPLEGRAILAAVASDQLLATQRRVRALPLADAALGPGCPLVKQGWIHIAVNGNTPYTTAFQLNRAVLARIAVDPVIRPPAERLAKSPTEGLGELRDPRVSMPDVILPASTTDELYDALALVDGTNRDLLPESVRKQLLYKGRGTVLLFEGPPGTGKTMAAEALAKHLDRRLFVARYDRVEDFLLGNSQKNVAKLFEEAAKAKAVLVLDEADALLASRTPVHQAWDQHRNTMVNLMLGCLEEHDGVVVLTTNLAVNLDPALERRLTARVRFGLPGLEERLRLWRRYLPEDLPLEGHVDFERLAHQYPMSGARVRNAVLSAIRKALRRNIVRAGDGAEAPRAPGTMGITAEDLTSSAAEEYRASWRDRGSRDDGADTANIGDLRVPGVDLQRVVLPDGLRRRLTDALVAMAPAARELFESPGFMETFRTGRGVVLLFEGPPGTGKSLTAEAVAGHLGKSMYLVTPERILSKWHGQTERALARVFDEAAGQQAVLVIDEADSLLEARGEASQWADRTSNNMVNLLLRKLEECTGVAILITNRPANLDPALERRLAARITFAPPDVAERVMILERHLPPGVHFADDVNLEELARANPLSGGRLRNAILTAIRQMLARDPAARVLDRATLEQGMRDAQSAQGQRPIGFGAGQVGPGGGG